MSNYNKLLNNFDEIGLLTFRDNIDQFIDNVLVKNKDLVDSFYDLTVKELELKQIRVNKSMISTAHFPFIKTFEDFDFTFQQDINKNQILDLKNLRFMENNENIIFLGSPGVGKTHLSTSIGIETAKARYSTYFINANDLIAQLKKAKNENNLARRLKHFASYSVLIIDEIGFLPIDKEDSNLFFQLVNMRYEKHPTIVTSNKSFSKWGEVFGDVLIANAIIDRLLHHSIVFDIVGPSYRLKDHQNLFKEE